MYVFIELFNFSFFSVTGWGIDLDYCDIEWFALEMNRDHSVVFEMAKVNINILGISELKWTGMGEFNSDDHYIYYCGQESLRRNELAIIVNKRVQNVVLGLL